MATSTRTKTGGGEDQAAIAEQQRHEVGVVVRAGDPEHPHTLRYGLVVGAEEVIVHEPTGYAEPGTRGPTKPVTRTRHLVAWLPAVEPIEHDLDAAK